MTERLTCRFLVSGRVQGVGFRDWVVMQAEALGIAGWVRNRGDGRVEILASGEGASVEKLAERCRHGPLAARVDDLSVEAAEEFAPARFERRPTA